MMITSFIEDDLKSQKTRFTSISKELRAPRYRARDLSEAKAENQALRKATRRVFGELGVVGRCQVHYAGRRIMWIPVRVPDIAAVYDLLAS